MWSAGTLGGLALAGVHRLLRAPVTQATGIGTGSQVLYFPFVAQPGPSIPMPRVVHMRNALATSWNGTDPFYSAVSQNIVDDMVADGLQWLTGQSSWSGVWARLFRRVHAGGYAAGQKIAIKINLNNSGTGSASCETHGNIIDALPHPVIALLRGLVAAGVRPSDVTLYDSIRVIPAFFRDAVAAAYPGVQFVGRGECSGTALPGYGKDPSLTIPFHDPDGALKPRTLANVLYDATYLINLPIQKRHSGDDAIPVTLGFKNHFGSINRISGLNATDPDNLHFYVGVKRVEYHPTYNPWVDIYSNPNIRNKTILTVGDGLYGAFGVAQPPARQWTVYGGQPSNSLFFATDPVAIDCVMADLLVAEGQANKAHTFDYLYCAQEAGLGVCEGTRAAPGGKPLQVPYGSGYRKIDYIRVDA